VRITLGQATVVRDFEWAVGDPIAQARWDVRPEASTWNTPLTADGFARWRDSLSKKEDEVNRFGDRWTLKTTAVGDIVKEGRLVVRADDFHPVEQHIRFADDRQLDLQELAFEIKTDEPVPQSVASSTMPETVPPRHAEVARVSLADLDEAELQLRYVMF